MSRYYNEETLTKKNIKGIHQETTLIKDTLETKITNSENVLSDEKLKTTYYQNKNTSNGYEIGNSTIQIGYKQKPTINIKKASKKILKNRSKVINGIHSTFQNGKQLYYTIKSFTDRLDENRQPISRELNQVLNTVDQVKKIKRVSKYAGKKSYSFFTTAKKLNTYFIHFIKNIVSSMSKIKIALLPIIMICFIPVVLFLMIPSFAQGERTDYNVPEASVLNEENYTFPLPKEFRHVSAHYGYYRPFGVVMRHYGTDFPAPIGTPVMAIADGVVVEANEYVNDDGVKIVGILHEKNLVSRYVHLDKYFVSVGEEIKRGEVLGLVGNTGRSTGPHLHLQVESDYTKGLGKTPFDARHLFPSLLGEPPTELEYTP